MYFRRLAKDSVIYGGGDLAAKVLAFFTFPIIAAELNPAVFGALELVTTTIALLGMFVNCGLNSAVQRFYWEKGITADQQPVIVSSGLVTELAFGLALVSVGLAAMPWLLDLVRQAELALTGVALLSGLALLVLGQWLQYLLDVTRLHLKPWRYLTLSFLNRVLGAIFGVVVVVYFHQGVDGLLAVQATVAFLVLPIALLMVRRDLTPKVDGKWIKELVNFGYPMIFAGLAFWLFGSMDRWMLASMSSVEEVGIYSVAFKFASVVLFVSQAFGQAWSPFAMKIRAEQPDNYRKIYGQVLLLVLFGMLFIGGGIALFAGELMSVLMPVEYLPSALPLAVLCFGICLQATQQVTAVGISLEKKTYIFARLAWITAAINFGLNYLLIPQYGAAGAGAATTISYLILTGSYLYYTQRLHPLVIEWRKLAMLLALGLAVAACALLFRATSVSWSVVTAKVSFAATCAFLGWLILPIRRFPFARA